MAKIPALPTLAAPAGNELVVIADPADGHRTKGVAIDQLAKAAVAPELERAEDAADRAEHIAAAGYRSVKTYGEREAIPLDKREPGLLVRVLEGSTDGGRVFIWNPSLAMPGAWTGLLNEEEKMRLDLMHGGIGQDKVYGLPDTLTAIRGENAALAAVKVGNLRAELFAGTAATVSWTRDGARPQGQIVSWNGWEAPLRGDVERFELRDWSRIDRLFVAGNSLSDITGAVDQWSQLLAAAYNIPLVSIARGSSDARQVFKAGARSLALTLAGALPANGSVAVTSINGGAPSLDSYLSPASFLNSYGGDPTPAAMTGWVSDGIASRHVTVSIARSDSTDYRMTQDAGGSAVTFAGPVTFTPDVAIEPARSLVGLWLGNNYFYSGVPGEYGDNTNAQLWRDLDALIQQSAGARIFVLPILPAADWSDRGQGTPFNAYQAANARTRARYPRYWLVDAQGRDLVDYIKAFGSDGSASDQADIAAGFTPRSCRYDALHLNSKGVGLVVAFLRAALPLQSLPPALTVGDTVRVTARSGDVADIAVTQARQTDTSAVISLGMGERLRDCQPDVSPSNGATSISAAGVATGVAIAAGQTGVASFLRPSLPIPPEIAARFAGTTIRLKAAFAATAGFLTDKPIATAATQLGRAVMTDGSSSTAGFTQQRLEQVGGMVYREVSYVLTGQEAQLALLAQIGASLSTAAAHSLELKSLSLVVDAVPAGARYTGADVVASWRAYEQRIGIGPIFADALGLGVSQNGGGTYLAVNGRTLGISTPAGSTGQNAAAGLIVPIDPSVSSLLAGKTGRVRLALLTSATFTRSLTATMRARYAIQFQGTISGNVLTLTSPAVNAVTGAAVAIPAGTQGVITTGLTGSPAFFMSGLASGTSGAVGSTYTLQNAQTGYTLPTTFTVFAYRFFSCVVDSDIKLSPTRRVLTVQALPNQPFAGDEIFIEPYVSQNGTAATATLETWQIEDASMSIATVPLGTVGGPAEVAQSIAQLRATASARALAAADAQATYFFGIGDVMAASAIADQTNTGTGGTTLSGNTATIPSGSSGRNMIFQRVWPFDGAANAGKRVRLKLGFNTSDVFTRALTCAMQVRTSAGTVIRSATIAQQIAGRQITYTIDYTAQGDEIALAPYVICSSTGATATVETWTYASMLVYFMTAGAPGRSVADENISQLASSILAQAAALVVNGSGAYAGVKTVKPAGGDFTHPKLALDAITDATAAKRYAVLIFPGTYDGYAEWHTKDYVDLIGVGRREEVVIQYALPNDAPAATISTTSTFWWDTASNLVNLTVTARNMRYAVHQETNGQRVGITQIAENCQFIHYGNDAAPANTWQVGSQAAMGTGSSDGMTAIHRWCRFVGPGVTGYHGPNAGPARARPIRFRWEGCEMVVTRGGAVVINQPAMVFNPLQQGPGDIAELIGNSIGGEVHYMSGWLNAADTTTNRAQIAVVGYGNTPFTFVNKITGAPGGDYLPRLTGR